MKKIGYTLAAFALALEMGACADSDSSDFSLPISWVDTETPQQVLPQNEKENVVSKSWKLVFSDEFNDGEINFHKWSINDDTQTRSPRPALGVDEWFHKPSMVSEQQTPEGGMLVLGSQKVGSDRAYCSSVNSSKKFLLTYGYVEARIKVSDTRKAIHTAFWLQSPTVGHVDGTGNDGAEIDVFESAFVADKTASTIHIDGYGGAHQENHKRYDAPGLHSGYHVWGVYWDETAVRIYYDGKQVAEFTELNGEKEWISHAQEYLQLSTGVSWANEGDFRNQPADAPLTEAYVDYIRVWSVNK